MHRSFSTKSTTLPNNRRGVFLIVAAIVALAALVAILELTHTTHIFMKEKPVSGIIKTQHAIATSKSAASPNAQSNSSSSSSSNQITPGPDTPKSTNTVPANNTTLTAPYGTFISNHRPSLSGNPAPSQVQSVCRTTPGAQCSIKFEKDGATKTLPAQTADSDGAVFWTWDVKDNGLDAGSWKTTAIATLGSQSKSTADALNLEVQP